LGAYIDESPFSEESGPFFAFLRREFFRKVSKVIYAKLYNRSAEKWQKDIFRTFMILFYYAKNSLCHFTYFWQKKTAPCEEQGTID